MGSPTGEPIFSFFVVIFQNSDIILLGWNFQKIREDEDMKRMLAAACAAMLLCGSLTACGTTTTKPNNAPSTNTNGTTNSPNTNRTSYSTREQPTHPAGADQDRAGYNRMLNNQGRFAGTSDGRYTAYSDGAVSRRGAEDSLVESGKKGGQNLVNGARSIVGDVNRNVRDMGGVPRADDMPAK